MKSKWFRVLTALFMLFLLLFLLLYVFNRSGRYRNTDTVMNRVLLQFFSNNKVLVKSKELNTISITWRSEKKKRKIFRNGKVTGSIENFYGPQVFEIYRNDTLICSMSQWKSAWWHTHDYVFTVNYDSCRCKVNGPDEIDLIK